ncbi:MAG: hypothetical protein M1587_11485 [Thaumarchaeota archaeon]|nr:hypothetical protein [Nitrososphaerota archaeon]
MPRSLEGNGTLEEGWIKLHRSILTHPVFQDSELLHLFLYCIIKANHRPERILWNRHEITIQRGQFVFGRKKASKATKIKQSTVYRKMMILKNLEVIDIQPNNKFSTVTILNYGTYQDVRPQVEQQEYEGTITNHDQNFDQTENPDSIPNTTLFPVTPVKNDRDDDDPIPDEQQSGQQMNNNGTTSEQQLNTNKNDKNEKNDKKKRKVFSFDSIEYELSKLLLTEIRKNDENFLASSPRACAEGASASGGEAPSLQRWALQIDRLIRLDHRPPEEIRQVIVFAETSPFWRSNILSGQKLREKYTTLLLQMKSQLDESSRRPAKTTNGKVHPCEIVI